MLNIKDAEAHSLAHALAKETGESMTRAVIDALRERLAQVQQRRRTGSAAELLAIGRRCAEGMQGPLVPHGDLLYDERGLLR